MRPLRRLIAVAAAITTAAIGAVVGPAGAQAVGYTPPSFIRSIGGHGEAAVYAWGMAFNPVSQEVLVGDYWNFQVRRYGLDGSFKGSFYRAANLRKGQPYTISVDPSNGDIFVAELSDGLPQGYFGKYDKAGTYLGEIRVSGGYPVWTSIDAARTMWIADAHNDTTPLIRRVNITTGSTITSFGSYGTTAGRLGKELHGIDTDSGGNVYVADSANRRVSVFTTSGTYLRTIGGPGTGLGQFAGDLRGLAIDKVNGLVYVVDASASEVDVFTTAGAPVRTFGSEGSGPGQFRDGGRDITIDSTGAIWVADYGGYRFHRFAPDGSLMGTYPDPAAGPVPGGFAQVRDVAVDPVDGSIWAADSWNNRFQKFDQDGNQLGAWGMRNSYAPYGMNYPRGIAVDPDTRRVWVANTRDHMIRVYEPDGTYVMTVGSTLDSANPGSFRWVMDLEFYHGKVYASDYTGGYFKVLDASTGAEISRVSLAQSGVAVNPNTGVLYVASWQNRKVYMYNADTLVYLGSFGSGGTGNGQFTNPWDIDVMNDVVYVADAKQDRVQAFSTTGSFLGAFGSTGTGAYQFNSPSGITHDAAGNIYVADAANDRIQVFSTTVAPTTGDTTAPVVAFTTANNEVIPAVSPVTIAGTYSDADRVAKVEVAIQDRTTKLWWDTSLATWKTTRSYNMTMMTGSPSSGTWKAPIVTFTRGQKYFAQVRGVDASGNVSALGPQVNFEVASDVAPDTVAPLLTITSPVRDATVPSPVTIGGQVTDDRAIGGVDVAIRDVSTNLWWQPATGTWDAPIKWMPSTVALPGTTGSGWSLSFSAVEPGKQYFVQARTTDRAGNDVAVKPTTRFKAS